MYVHGKLVEKLFSMETDKISYPKPIQAIFNSSHITSWALVCLHFKIRTIEITLRIFFQNFSSFSYLPCLHFPFFLPPFHVIYFFLHPKQHVHVQRKLKSGESTLHVLWFSIFCFFTQVLTKTLKCHIWGLISTYYKYNFRREKKVCSNAGLNKFLSWQKHITFATKYLAYISGSSNCGP